MDLYILEKTLKLDEFGKDWEGCEIVIRDPSVLEVKQMTTGKEPLAKVIKRHFVSGKVYDGKSVVEITSKDLEKLPLSVYDKLVDFILPSTLIVAKAAPK